MDIADITYHDDGSVTVYYADGTSKTTKAEGTPVQGSSGGIWGSIFGAIPGILSTLFPNGVGNSGNNYPVVTPTPMGTQVDIKSGSANTILIIALVAMAAYIILTKQPSKAKK